MSYRKEEVLEHKISCHMAEQEMLDHVGTVMFPEFGVFYKNESVKMWRAEDVISSLGKSNRSVTVVTDKPIDMYLPFNEFQEKGGFMAK